MKLNEVAVRRFIGVLMVVGIILLLGIVSIAGLPIDLLPELELPMVMVMTGFEGAGPSEVESMVTRPIEETVSTVDGLQDIQSSSSPGNSMVMASFSWGTDMDFAAMEVRESLDLVRDALPDEAEDPITLQMDPDMMPIMEIGLEGEQDLQELTLLAEDTVAPRLERIDGVANVDVLGSVHPRIVIEVSPDQLASYGVSLDDMAQVVGMENLDYPGGDLEDGKRTYQVRTVGEVDDPEELKHITVGAGEGGAVTLGDVAEIKEMPEKQTQISRLDDNPNVTLSVSKQADANTVEVASQVREAIDDMEGELPGGAGFAVAMDMSVFIEESIQNVAEMALIGGALAILIIFLFLRSFSPTFIIACAIPISLLATVSMLYFQGSTLNLITMGGVALGIGLMVDNSIVVLENIHRHRTLGLERGEASVDGAGQMFPPILAATLTTLVVFVPVVFIEGITQVIFEPLALTITFALAASLLVAMTVIPAFFSRLPEGKIIARGPVIAFHRAFEKSKSGYQKWLQRALQRPFLVVFMVVALLAISMFGASYLGGDFLPEMDSAEIMIDLELPAGTSLDETDRMVQEVEAIVGEIPEVQNVFSTVGGAGFIGEEASPEVASLHLNLPPREEREREGIEIVEEIREELAHLPAADVSVNLMDMAGGGMEEDAVELLIAGDDMDQLEELTTKVEERLEPLPSTREVGTSFDEGRPEMQLRVDREKAGELGFHTPQVANLVNMVLEGEMVSRLEQEGDEIDIYIEGREQDREDVRTLERLPVANPEGLKLPLEEVADITYTEGPTSIERDGQTRAAYVNAALAPGYTLTEVQAEIEEVMEEITLPAGYSYDYGGELADMLAAFDDLALALVLAVLLVYMIMAIQFESLLFPFIVMFTLPQAFTGVVAALLITGHPLSVPALIGAVMLAGIVVNNGIIMVDYINVLRWQQQYSLRDAIQEAGVVRYRPILMTTLTTVAGMFPLALGIGAGAELQAPLASVVVGGLSFSALVTLFFVPAMYLLVDRAGQKMMAAFQNLGSKRKRSKKTRKAEY